MIITRRAARGLTGQRRRAELFEFGDTSMPYFEASRDTDPVPRTDFVRQVQLNDMVRKGKVEKIGRGRTMLASA
jgi:hypothetical protein